MSARDKIKELVTTLDKEAAKNSDLAIRLMDLAMDQAEGAKALATCAEHLTDDECEKVVSNWKYDPTTGMPRKVSPTAN